MRAAGCRCRWPQSLISGVAVLLSTSVLAPVAGAHDKYKVDIVPQIPHSEFVTSVLFSPNGREVLSGSADKSVKLWDMATGRLLRTFEGHSDAVASVAFSADGARVLSGSGDKTLKLWDAATGQLLRTFEGHTDAVTSVAFSPDGRRVLSGSADKMLKLWNADTGQLLRTFEGHTDAVTSVAFSPDGRRVLSGSADETLKLWDAATGQVQRTFEGDQWWINSVAFSPNGAHVLSGSEDQTIKLWDVATGHLLHSFKGHSDKIKSVAFSPDGARVLSGSHDKTLKLWDAAAGKLLRTIEEAHSQVITSVAFSPDGARVLSGSFDNTLKLWDAASGEVLGAFEGHSQEITSVAFSPDGARVLLGSADKTAKLWDAVTGRLLRTLEHAWTVTSVAFSPDGAHVLSVDDAAKLWDPATGQVQRTFKGDSYSITVAFSPDGRRVLSASGDKLLRLWDAATGHLLRTFEGHSASVDSVAFSPDGAHVLSGGEDKTLKLWDAATGQLLRTFEGHEWVVTSVAFSPDGAHVLSGSYDNTLKLWEAATGKLLRTFEGHSAKVTSVAFSPDGAHVLSGGADKTLKLWDAATGQLLLTFEGHFGRITSVSFSHDGRHVVSGSDDTTARVWNTETGDPVVTLIASRDGEWLVLTPEGFFNASSPKAAALLGIVRGLESYGIDQMWQSLYAPDLVREKLAGDPNGEVAKAATVTSLDKVLDSGKAPKVAIVSPVPGATSVDEIITAEATIAAQEGGIGRVEWRVNGITVGVSNPARGTGAALTVKQTLALDPGDNTIEIVAYNGRNLLASLPAESKVTWTGTVAAKPKLHLLSIGINKYIDTGGIGATGFRLFPPLGLAVPDALALAGALERAGYTLYGEVRVRTVLDEEATSANLDAIVTEMAADIDPRDTFVLFAATHGYSYQGRFYLIPQDYQGGTDPQALATHAVNQLKLQDWIANRIKAKRALILLDSCESGALTSGHGLSRFDGAASDAAVGRLHEAIGRPVLTAAGLGQSALEITELGHGVFTSALIDSFYRGDANSDGVVSVAELVAHVQDLVPRLVKDPKARADVVRRGPIGGVQSARFGGRGEDFSFVHRIR